MFFTLSTCSGVESFSGDFIKGELYLLHGERWVNEKKNYLNPTSLGYLVKKFGLDSGWSEHRSIHFGTLPPIRLAWAAAVLGLTVCTGHWWAAATGFSHHSTPFLFPSLPPYVHFYSTWFSGLFGWTFLVANYSQCYFVGLKMLDIVAHWYTRF